MTNEFEKLIHAYISGTTDADSMARLNALLSENEEARREFAEFLNLDSMIAATAAGWSSEEEDQATSIKRRTTARTFAMAASIVVFISGFFWWQSSQRVFAAVEKSLGASLLPAGAELKGKLYALEKGTIEIVTARGARLVIEAPAEFRFETAQRLRMLRGRLAADVPSTAKGFTVITPSGEAVDLGTRFGVDVPESGASEIHVFEGEVIAKASGAKTRKSLLAGDALTMEDGKSTERNLRTAAFIQSDELRELSMVPGDNQQPHAEEVIQKLRKDPALIALLDFENDESHQGTYRMVQGRWPGSKAAEFVNDGDHLKLDIGGDKEWPQITLAAWVRLDQLGAMYQSLLHIDGWDQEYFGRVHWMVNQAATMRFAVWGNTLAPGADEKFYYPDSRTPVLSDRGRWVHMATVYDSDAGTVRFYLNGRFDKETLQSASHPARLGVGQMGNWNREERKLSGRVDEFVILGRLMSDDQVRHLYEAGNPYF